MHSNHFRVRLWDKTHISRSIARATRRSRQTHWIVHIIEPINHASCVDVRERAEMKSWWKAEERWNKRKRERERARERDMCVQGVWCFGSRRGSLAPARRDDFFLFFSLTLFLFLFSNFLFAHSSSKFSPLFSTVSTLTSWVLCSFPIYTSEQTWCGKKGNTFLFTRLEKSVEETSALCNDKKNRESQYVAW